MAGVKEDEFTVICSTFDAPADGHVSSQATFESLLYQLVADRAPGA